MQISVFVFLFAMVFSLFQSVPMCEEDPHVKTELVKKNAKENGSGGEDGDEDAGDTFADDYIGAGFSHGWSHFYTHTNFYTRAMNWHNYFVQNKNTPPPKV